MTSFGAPIGLTPLQYILVWGAVAPPASTPLGGIPKLLINNGGIKYQGGLDQKKKKCDASSQHKRIRFFMKFKQCGESKRSIHCKRKQARFQSCTTRFLSTSATNVNTACLKLGVDIF